MSQVVDYDYIIVGQGIAGSIVAWHLLERKYRVLILTQREKPGCSLIAAGILNPVTGKRLAKSWSVDNALPEAKKLYRSLEDFFGKTFFKPRDIIRLYKSLSEKKIIENRREDPEYASFLGDSHSSGAYTPYLYDPLGSFSINQGGCLDMRGLLLSLETFFKEKKCLRDQCVQPDQLKINADTVTLNGIRAKKVIFCDGYRGAQNFWFSWLPFQPAKGEIISISASFPEELQESIINHAHWIVPQGNGVVKIGAAYDRRDFTEAPTQVGREELLAAFRAVRRTNYSESDIIEHSAGIRPCTQDAKPFVGVHPLYPQIALFNGLGSKGALLVPFCSLRLIDFLEKGEPLNPEMNIARHWKKS